LIEIIRIDVCDVNCNISSNLLLKLVRPSAGAQPSRASKSNGQKEKKIKSNTYTPLK